MLRVRIRDFQSIRDGTFDIDRFTVITGTNNLGKSALFRAVKGVFTNPAATFVREGEKFSVVTLSDGTSSVEWRKGPKVSAVYKLTVDGKTRTFENVGHACPPEVLKAFGIGTLQAGNALLWPQFADQFTGPLFLLDKPGSAIADAVANVERIQTLNRALKACESDKRSAVASLKVRKADQEGIERRLSRFDGLDTVVTRVESLETTRAKAERVASGHKKLDRLRRQYLSAKAQVEALRAAEGLEAPEDEAQAVGHELVEVHGLRQRLTAAQERLLALEGFDAVMPEEKLLATLRRLQEGLKKLRQLRKQVVTSGEQVERWREIAEIAQDVEIDPSLRQKAEQIQQVLKLLRALRTEMKVSREQVEACESELAEAQVEFDALSADLAEVLERYDDCPLCGAAIEHEHV